MKIGIPVKCQNGHKAVWMIEISGLDAVSTGTFGDPDRCKCPKHDIGQGYFPDGAPFLLDQTAASRDVLAERQRQVQGEGWTAHHDDDHDGGELSAAASAYALYAADELNPHSQGDGDYANQPPDMWPWLDELAGRGEGHVQTIAAWWKPSNPRRALVKAAALILAEIERIDRGAGKEVAP